MARKAAPKRTAAKKKKAPVKKKIATKRSAVKKTAPVRKSPPAVSSKMTKTQILTEIAEKTNLNRKQVNNVLEELETVIQRHIKKRAVGEFTLPGLLKIRSVKRPATKKRAGRNPATGEEITIPAKPASIRVRATPLKKLKDMAT